MVRRELGTPREFASSDVTIVATVSDYTSASASGATEGCCGHAVASGHVIEFRPWKVRRCQREFRALQVSLGF